MVWDSSIIGSLLKLIMLYSIESGNNGRPVEGETPSTDTDMQITPDNKDNDNKSNKAKRSKYVKLTTPLRSDAITHPLNKVGASANITLTNKDVKAILAKV
jgi:hypothetical protein